MAIEQIRDEKEVWKVVPGYDGRYEVSSLGRVRSLDFTVPFVRHGKPVVRVSRGRLLKQHMTSQGYYFSVPLSRDGSSQRVGVHILVCCAWHGPRPPKHQAAHNNGDGHDNRPENLRWATSLENAADKLLHGTDARGEKHGQAKATEEMVRDIRRRFSAGERLVSIRASYPQLGRTCVPKIAHRQRWAWLE